MSTKINYDQLDNLLFELKRHEVPTTIILNLLNIESLAELTVSQYNCLLLLTKS